MSEILILVDTQDHPIGTMEKLAAHQQGLLHRAFSVFIFNSQGQLLLQQRHRDKYHCGGLWTNTCCSHPRVGESTLDAAQRRLQEELGFSVPLTHKGHFIYRAEFSNGLTEHELDHVFVGYSDIEHPPFDAQEIAAVKWVDIHALTMDLAKKPECYTPWFNQAFQLALS